jgi:hypothetical protein
VLDRGGKCNVEFYTPIFLAIGVSHIIVFLLNQEIGTLHFFKLLSFLLVSVSDSYFYACWSGTFVLDQNEAF